MNTTENLHIGGNLLMGLSSLSWLWINYWFFQLQIWACRADTCGYRKSAHLMWISGQRNIVRQQPILKINKMSLKYCKNNKQKPIWFLVLQMEHCANFALHNKSQKALLGMFILCFYPDFIFALNCDNSLTVFMLKVSCLCHERRFSSI